MPSTSAAEKPKITLGPSSSSAVSVISIVAATITVRASVSLTERLSSCAIGMRRYFFRFSRIRS